MDEVMIVCYKASNAEYKSYVAEKDKVYKVAELTNEGILKKGIHDSISGQDDLYNRIVPYHDQIQNTVFEILE